jgi:hypothetical protein
MRGYGIWILAKVRWMMGSLSYPKLLETKKKKEKNKTKMQLSQKLSSFCLNILEKAIKERWLRLER